MARSVKQHCADPILSIPHSFVLDMVHCLSVICDFKSHFLQIMEHYVEQKVVRQGLLNVINAVVRIFFL